MFGVYSSAMVPTDLSGSVWDTTTAEGTQNFHGDAEDFPFSFGHITPRGNGQDHIDVVDDISSKWIAAEEAPAVVSEPMRRISSRSSAGSHSHKHRTLKAASQQKSRPTILSQGSHMSSYDMSGNGHMEAYLLDSDAHSVTSQMYYPSSLPMGMGMTSDGLPYSPEVIATGMPQQHMDPTHMQLDFDASLTGNSPTASWASSFSPGEESRTGSPAVPEDSWSSVPLGTSPQAGTSSPIMDGQSPSLHRGLIGSEDSYGNDLMDNSFLPPAFTRRSSGDNESSARDHPLYKNAMPKADGLFHCPWEGDSSCNHKAEKLKCNYDKFVDSHLKPYRCKVDSCENARFSSTACLLRHEREAHAMHGHGDKPYLCTYEGCDRAVPGCGFPRNWNLRDHMRRVHNDNGASLSSGAPSSASGRGSASHSAKGRKRKSKDSSEMSSHGRKPVSKTSAADDAAAAARAAEQPLIEQWYEHHSALQEYLQRYNNPVAFELLDQTGEAGEHFSSMEKISRKLKKSRESHRRAYHHSG
ncbi:C2H2 transcription factor [Apiospora arundinis]|uniref:C2H2-type domain-containing protein n=1 Tax=Apiospora arundinis TaxID=335852 RepID=A0ABR2J8C4_9PEZI